MDFHDESNYGPPPMGMSMMGMYPQTRYDDLSHLSSELEQEKRYREGIEWSNSEMERSIAELETYVRDLDDSSREADDNEWKVRFESQTALNKQLQEQRDWLETELSEARRKLTTGSYPEAMNFNLDALNEAELLRLVKHLERMRNDYYSTLRDTEWKLDKESKEFHHYDEMRRVYKADLKHANQTIERMRMSQVLDPNGVGSPFYPSGYYRDSRKESKSGKSPSRKGRSKSPSKKEGRRSPTRSPTRSKSRNENRSKKKEEPSEEQPPAKSGSEQEGGTEGSGADQEGEEKPPEGAAGGEDPPPPKEEEKQGD